MADGVRRDRRSVTERRGQLVDAAIEVIAAEGLACATTRRITERAGLALGAFHYAFDSKGELLRAVMERIAETVEQRIMTATGTREVPLDVAVGRVTRSFWTFAREAPELRLACYELLLHALRDPELRVLAVRQYDRYVAAVATALGQVQQPPADEERQELARYLVATIDGLVLHAYVDSDADAGARRLERHLRSLTRPPALATA